MVMTLAHGDGSVRGSWQGSELFRYVYQPPDPVIESPRPYFHPVKTLGGDLVSLQRPHDHAWHKGIAWSLSNVGPANFWAARRICAAWGTGSWTTTAGCGTRASTR